jgi:hypothetical protein
MTTVLVLDALEQAIWTRRQAGITEFDGLVHHNDAGWQSGRGTYLVGAGNSGLGDCGLADDVEGACQVVDGDVPVDRGGVRPVLNVGGKGLHRQSAGLLRGELVLRIQSRRRVGLRIGHTVSP